jgi:predicted transcriptional regulator
MSQKNSKTKMVTMSFRIDKEIVDKLKAIAKSRGISMSALIRECIQDYLDREEKEGLLK